MKKIILSILLSIFTASVVYCKEVSQQLPQPKGTLPLTLFIKSDKQVYRIGEEIILTATFNNVLEKEMIVFWGNKKPKIFTEELGAYNVAIYVKSTDETLYVKPKQSIEKTIVITLDNKIKPIKEKLGLILLYNSQNLILDYKHRSDQEIFTGILISPPITIVVKEKKGNAGETHFMKLKFNFDEGKRWWTFMLDNNEFRTLSEIKIFIKNLHTGSKIEWAPGCRRLGDEPLLNSESEMKDFKKFCDDNGITLVVIPSG